MLTRDPARTGTPTGRCCHWGLAHASRPHISSHPQPRCKGGQPLTHAHTLMLTCSSCAQLLPGPVEAGQLKQAGLHPCQAGQSPLASPPAEGGGSYRGGCRTCLESHRAAGGQDLLWLRPAPCQNSNPVQLQV
eukprot:363514-Chlamydomonas_euryale.AAC.10